MIVSNTTLDRPASLVQDQEGGLSGRPLYEKSLRTMKYFRHHLGANLPIIGVGGISDEEKAQSFLSQGADLIQIYTGLVYKGTGIVQNICKL